MFDRSTLFKLISGTCATRLLDWFHV